MSDGYTLKEMIQEMRDAQKADSARLIRTLEHAKNVDEHLDALNSKVATNARKINELDQFKGRAMLIWGVAVTVIVTIAQKLF